MAPDPIKPTHKAIKAYYQQRAALEAQHVHSEMNVRAAFQNLLEDTARTRGWTLVPELSKEVRGGRTIRPDGTLRDEYRLPRGYWESKDSHDDLDTEIRRKRERGYPTSNIIFEDTRQAVLLQDGQEAYRADLGDPDRLADLLNLFYAYTEPEIEGFEQAVGKFQEDMRPLAEGLKERIGEAHRGNKKFQAAFESFFTLCREALNPNIRREAVDEMLIQHLLTERVLRTVFDMPHFVQRNVIAGEVERVIEALTSRHFNRTEFLGQLDYFYTAIEAAARGLHDFSDKQFFLNTVYERFFQGYSVRVADTHGIVYTPQEIVDFMGAAVEEVLRDEFGLKLGDPGVNVLDPCTGTGNFVVNLLRRVAKANPRQLEAAYRERFFANEVMLMPYYIAALNIEHAYHELSGEYAPFEGLCFVDTLDLETSHLIAGQQVGLPGLFTAENAARVQREQDANIFVILGNPPYNVGQLNENDNNKNRKYAVVDQRVSKTYAADSAATNKNALSDPYVKFFRWATDRLGTRDGVICFVSNNSFVDQIAFDGMRKHLLQDFTRVYHIDLHGNVRQNPKLSGTTHNVFGIQVGVGITVAVRSSKHQERALYYCRVPEMWRREEKLGWLANPTPGPSPLRGEGRKQMGETGSGEGRGQEDEGRKQMDEGVEVRVRRSRPEMWAVLRPLAREMRHEQTPAENALWQAVRDHRLGVHFRRQHGFDRFIVDFYCHAARLVVEVDGEIHQYTREQDAARQEFLESLGLRVLRVTNDQVLHDLDSTLTTIRQALASLPSPQRGEGPGVGSRGEEPGVGSRGEGQTEPPGFVGVGSRGEGPGSLDGVTFHRLTPDARHTWLVPDNAAEFAAYLPIGSREVKAGDGALETIFRTFSNGVKTNRDSIVYDYDRAALSARVRQFIEDYNAEVDRWKRSGGKGNVDDFVNYSRIKWSESLKANLQRGNYADFREGNIRSSLYRPFNRQFLYFDDLLNERRYQFPSIFPTPATEAENRVIWLKVGDNWPVFALMVNHIPDLLPQGGSQCFPFYTYESAVPLHEHGEGQTEPPGSVRVGSRRENITDWALAQFRAHYADETISKWDIFYYVYGLLHHPEYRERYADNLKRDLPRLPLPHPEPSPQGGEGVFRAFSEAGRRLADLHLNYEQAAEYPLGWIVKEEARLDYRVRKMRLTGKQHGAAGYSIYDTLVYNDTLTLRGIPAAAFDYRLGHRSALEWVVDQYQVSTDARSGITSDPNQYAPDDPQYIVRLVGQVITISLETVKIVAGLPDFR